MKILTLLVAFSSLIFSNAVRADPASDLLKIINRPKVPLNPEVEQLPHADDVLKYHFTYATQEGTRVPGLIYKLAGDQRRPVVIVAHGTEESKDMYVDLLSMLAKRGFIAVAIDGRYFGERISYGKTTFEYCDKIAAAYYGSGEHPLYYDTVWDDLRLLDYLENRPDVDASRIGMTGVSKGGIETYMTTAIDPRIKVAAPLIAMQGFKWELDNNLWMRRVNSFQKAFDKVVKQEGINNPTSAFVAKFYDRVVPGIYGEFDGPALIKLIAPRPLFISNGGGDGITPKPSVELCIAIAKETYAKDHASDRFEYQFEDTDKHLVSPKTFSKVVDWFARWLKP